MCKRKKAKKTPVPVVKKPATAPAVEEKVLQGNSEETPDYFSEYYKTYKNTYLDQYLNAYRHYKKTGEIDEAFRELQLVTPDEETVE